MSAVDKCFQRSNTPIPLKWLLSIAAVSLIVRLACMLLLQSWEFEDEWEFGHEMGAIGKWLALGEGFSQDGTSPSSKSPPVYPLLVAVFFYTFGVYSKSAAVGLFVFQSFCAAGVAVCLANLGSRLFNRTAGIIAGFIWAFYPTSIFYSVVHIWYCELALLFLALCVTIALTTGECIRYRRMALLGALSGFTVLIDSTLALYLPLLFLWMLAARRVQFSRVVRLSAIWGMTAVAVLSPWMIRNGRTIGSFQFLKSNFGLELFVGNSSVSSGRDSHAKAQPTFATLDQQELAFYKTQPQAVYYRYLRDKAIEWVRRHPVDFLLLTVRRAWYFWVFNPSLGWGSWLRLSYFGTFLVIALYGLGYSVRHWREFGAIWLFLLVYPLPYYLTNMAHGRYSYPVEPFVILLAAISVTFWLRRKDALPALADTEQSKRGNPSLSC